MEQSSTSFKKLNMESYKIFFLLVYNQHNLKQPNVQPTHVAALFILNKRGKQFPLHPQMKRQAKEIHGNHQKEYDSHLPRRG